MVTYHVLPCFVCIVRRESENTVGEGNIKWPEAPVRATLPMGSTLVATLLVAFMSSQTNDKVQTQYCTNTLMWFYQTHEKRGKRVYNHIQAECEHTVPNETLQSPVAIQQRKHHGIMGDVKLERDRNAANADEPALYVLNQQLYSIRVHEDKKRT